MKKTMFVWEYASGLTSNYHDGGGVVVIAGDKEAAIELLKREGDVSATSEVFTKNPDFTASVVTKEDKVFIFPDAGCC